MIHLSFLQNALWILTRVLKMTGFCLILMVCSLILVLIEGNPGLAVVYIFCVVVISYSWTIVFTYRKEVFIQMPYNDRTYHKLLSFLSK